MRLILLLVLPVLMLFGLALVLMWAPLPRSFPPAPSSARNLMAAISVGMLGMFYLVGIALVIVGQILRVGRSLDEVLAAHVGLIAAVGDHRPLRPSADAVRVDSSLLQDWAPVVWVEAGQAEHLAALLTDPAVASALFQLLAASEPGGVRDLRLARDHIEFRARPSADAAGQCAGEWVQTLSMLAAQLERTQESRISDG